MKTTYYKSISKKLKFDGKTYINGKYVNAIDGGKFKNNIAIGAQSLNSTAGNDVTGSTAVGHNSLTAVIGGDNNLGIGVDAGDTITTGDNNTIVGSSADASASGATGQIAIGQAVTCVGDNTITVGIGANTASLGLDGSDTSWAPVSSDERLKENIETSTAGLSFVNDLRPVTYNWKKAKDVQKDLTQYKNSEEPVLGHEYGETLHGFIAQEVKTVIDAHPELKDGFGMWGSEGGDGRQRIGDGALVPMLTKAIQELSAKVTALENA